MLDALFENYARLEYVIATSQLFLAMLGMGCLLTPRDFLLEVKRPRGLIVGLGFQWALAPLVAIALGALTSPPAGIAAGLILIAAVPGGTASNILTLFGRGNIALSISITAITTVAALVTTPVLLQLLLAQYLPENFSMPSGQIALDIFGALIVPLLIGMVLQHQLGAAFAAPFSKWCIRLSLTLILIMVVGAAGSGRLDAEAYGVFGLLLLLSFVVLLKLSSFAVCRIAGLNHKDTLAIVIEAGFRNISLAVAIKAVVFPAQQGVLDPIGDAVFFAILLFGGVSLFLSVIPVFVNRHIAKSIDRGRTSAES